MPAHEYEPLANAAIAAHIKALREAGYVIVPCQPTGAMLLAARQLNVHEPLIAEHAWRAAAADHGV